MPASPPNPASIDFAALDMLRVVHELGSFTAAAEKLNVNQSAVSYTIGKLRACFQDPLFVREGGRQVATDRCEEILAKSLQMLGMLDEMLQPDAFAPEQATQNVTIACNYYERVLLIPGIVAAIRQVAPKMTVKVISSLSDGHLRLLRREADVLIGPFERAESGFHSRRLYGEEYACLMDPGHPQARTPLDADRYLSLNHVLIDYGAGWQSAFLRELEAAGHRLTPTIVVPSPAGLGTLIAGSDLVATIPRRLGARDAETLTLAPSPFRGRFDVSLVWAAHTNASAMHRWLRDLIWSACRG